MLNRQPTQPRSYNLTACLRLGLVCLLGIPLIGCNSFGNGKLVQQLQNENERLLTEFRAERERREEAERVNSTLEARLSESEKLLARQSLGTSPNRISSLQPNLGSSATQLPAGTTNLSSGSPTGNQQGLDASSDGSGDSNISWQRRIK